MLQELRFAATQNSISTEQLGSSMSTFVKRLSATANGSGAAVSTYARLGISLLEADGSLRESGTVLNDVADALKGMDSQVERAVASTALLGRESPLAGKVWL